MEKSKTQIKALLVFSLCTYFVTSRPAASLHDAVKAGDEELTAQLLERGVDVNVIGEDGNTLLHCVALTGNVKLFLMLCAHGAKSICNEEGQMPADVASSAGNIYMQRFLERYHPNYIQQKSEILNAVEQGNVDETIKILEQTPTLCEIRNAQGMTLLHIAAKEGHADLVGHLVYFGADVNAVVVRTDKSTRKEGWTPLHYAVVNWESEIVESLILAGACPNLSDSHGDTPLHWAVGKLLMVTDEMRRSIGLENISRLIEAGANPDTPNVDRETARKIAAKEFCNDILAFFPDVPPDVSGVSCVICQDSLEEGEDHSYVVSIKCGHVLHRVCYQRCRKLNKCPLCPKNKTSTKKKDWKPLYFNIP